MPIPATEIGLSFVYLAFAATLPCYIPLIFLAYAIGRKQFSTRFLLILLTVEAAAIAWMMHTAVNFNA